jgi:DNA-3-methyladenine glycosylase
MSPLPADYYARPTLEVARDMLNALLVYDGPEGRVAGRVVETEAYLADDPAFHGWKAKFDPTGRVLPGGKVADLFGPPGRAYVYLIYYTNWLLNAVTEPEGEPGAVLVRALEPVEGEAVMTENRPKARRRVNLTNGPGKLTQALGIASGDFHGTDLTRPPLYFAEDGTPAPEVPVVTSRIGISRGADLPYRFCVPGNPFVSPGVPSDERLAKRQEKQRKRR